MGEPEVGESDETLPAGEPNGSEGEPKDVFPARNPESRRMFSAAGEPNRSGGV